MTTLNPSDFPPCPVCGTQAWTVVHQGAVRDGTHGRSVDSMVGRCTGCGIERLAESTCLDGQAYSDASYRAHVGQDHDIENHYASHDELSRFTLDTLWPHSVRGKLIADVGCGGGSLLDNLSGLARELIAIDPAQGFADSLQSRGYRWFPSAEDAADRLAGSVDVAFAIQVIEHVEDPKAFLEGIRRLLKPDGFCIVSTPNRADILMDLLPDDFPSFFYRSQHRWAFDADALVRAAAAAGFSAEIRHVHRYGMANSLLWLREKRPSGRLALPVIDATADGLWRAWLEANGRADNLYVLLRRTL